MELLDRYIYDVGRRLPEKQREDIEKELKSLLMDAIEAKTEGREPTAEEVSAVLVEFGSPTEVAARYSGEQYVVGPRYYGIYMLLVKIVLGAVTVGLFISMAAGVFFIQKPDAGFASYIAQFISGFVNGLLAAFGSVTLVFVMIERVSRRKGKLPQPEKWNPKDLPPIPRHSKEYKRSSSIAAIVFIIIGFIVFNVYPDMLALYYTDAQGIHQVVPLLSDAMFTRYLPLWNIGWALTLTLHVALLMQGRWNVSTRLVHIALEVYTIFVAVFMLSGPQFLNSIFIEKVSMHMQPVSFFMDFRWVFVLVIIGSAVEIAVTAVRLIKEKIE